MGHSGGKLPQGGERLQRKGEVRLGYGTRRGDTRRVQAQSRKLAATRRSDQPTARRTNQKLSGVTSSCGMQPSGVFARQPSWRGLLDLVRASWRTCAKSCGHGELRQSHLQEGYALRADGQFAFRVRILTLKYSQWQCNPDKWRNVKDEYPECNSSVRVIWEVHNTFRPSTRSAGNGCCLRMDGVGGARRADSRHCDGVGAAGPFGEANRSKD